MPLNLRNRIERHAHHDQQRGTAKIERHAGRGNQEFRQETDKHNIDGADNGDARQHIVYIFGSTLTRTNAGDEAGMLLELVSRVLGIEHDGRVKKQKNAIRPA